MKWIFCPDQDITDMTGPQPPFTFLALWPALGIIVLLHVFLHQGCIGHSSWHLFQLKKDLNLFSSFYIQYCVANIYKDVPRTEQSFKWTATFFTDIMKWMDLRQTFGILYSTLWFQSTPTWHPFIAFDSVFCPLASSNPFSRVRCYLAVPVLSILNFIVKLYHIIIL
jgi:hypothetical protein